MIRENAERESDGIVRERDIDRAQLGICVARLVRKFIHEIVDHIARETHDRKSRVRGHRREDLGEHAREAAEPLRLRDHDGRRLGLEYEPCDREPETAGRFRDEGADAADLESVEDGVLNRRAVRDERERPRIAAGWDGFKGHGRGSEWSQTNLFVRAFARCR